MQKAQEMGADHVINYKAEDWSKAVFVATGKRGVDVVVDNVGAATWTQSVRGAHAWRAIGQRWLHIGASSGDGPAARVPQTDQHHRSTMGSHQDFRDVMSLIWSGELHPVINRVMPLSEGRAAHELLERGEQFGKIVLVP